MYRTKLSPVERNLRTATGRVALQQLPELPGFQVRTCARCGRRTTFALEDRAGWYACSTCGRFA